jgi:hypothetical protein
MMLGTVDVRGYGGYAEGPPLSGIIQPWPRGSMDPTFLANGPNQLQLIDAATRTVVRAFPDSIHNPLTDPPSDGRHCTRGPGPTYDPDVFILCPEPYTRVAYDIGGDEPQLVEERCFTDYNDWVYGLIAPGYWLSGSDHYVYRIKCPEGVNWALPLDVIEPEYIRFSPRGDRTVILGNAHGDGGAPVLDADGAIAFRIAEFEGVGWVAGAGFSSDGATLYAAMYLSAVGGITVLSLDATAGARLAQVTPLVMPYGGPADLLVDSEGGWVYALAGDRWSGRWSLAVLDLESLATVAVLESDEDTCTVGWPVGLVLGANQSAVFLVNTHDNWQSASPESACIQRFDLWR